MFGDDDAMRVDMSEFMEKHAVSRLVGVLQDMLVVMMVDN